MGLSATFGHLDMRSTLGKDPLHSNDLKVDDKDLVFFKKLIEISSPSENVDGVNRVQVELTKKLHALGFQTQLIPNPRPDVNSGHLLIAELPGNSQRFVNIVGHADTVLSTEYHGGELRIEGNKAFGSGVIDDKGGVLVALMGLRKALQICEQKFQFGVRFICSPNEEVGSPGFHEIFKKLGQDAEFTFGFEPASGDGDIVTSRKGNRWYDIHVYGEKAHAGRDFTKGVNACQELATKLLQTQGLTQVENGMTVNIGKIAGGTKHNVVSDYAYGQLDVRFPCFESRSHLVQHIHEILNSNQGDDEAPEVKYKVVDDCPPLASCGESLQLFENYAEFVDHLEGRQIEAENVGGASDCNHFSHPGKVIIDGLGPVGEGMHTEKECILLNSLETRSQSFAYLLSFLNQL